MTAIRCEIIIGANKAAAQVASAHHVSQNIGGNNDLSQELLRIMSQFSTAMDSVFARYLVWSAGGPPGELPPGVTGDSAASER
jgi:hypothetical protein